MNGDEVALLRNDVSYIREAVRKMEKGWTTTLKDVRANQLEIAKGQALLGRHWGRMDRIEKVADATTKNVEKVERNVQKIELTFARLAGLLLGAGGVGGMVSKAMDLMIK